MRKVRKMVVGLLMVFGAVSVSFGYDIIERDEAMYQKLKAEMEEVEQKEDWDIIEVTCSWGEDGKVVVGGRLSRSEKGVAEDWCHLKNVLAFVDEYRKFDEKELEKELKKFNKNARVWGSDVYMKVEKMPRFKEDSGIYGWKSIGTLLENALEKWKETKFIEMHKLY